MVHPKYRPLIDKVNSDYILNPLTEAFRICKALNKQQLKVLKKAVLQNNRIRELCNGSIKPILYSEIEKIDENLSKRLKKFCNELYDSCIYREPFYSEFGRIEAYYNDLVDNSYTCRSCGRGTILTRFNSARSAFDHYLPRKHYPFSAVNFRNLVPICDICNESYKNQQDPLVLIENKGKANERRKSTKAFYPFRRATPDIRITLTLKTLYSSNLQPDDIEIDVVCVGFEDEVATWIRIFGIKENYKSAYCSREMYGYYEEQYLAMINYGLSHDDYIQMLENNRFYDLNFLKIPFLETVR